MQVNLKPNPEPKQLKNLFIFDFDKTLVEQDSYTSAFADILNFQDEMNRILSESDSASHFNKLANSFIRSSGVDFTINKSRLESILFLPGIKELLEYLINFKINSDFIIISGSLSVFVDYFLRKNKIDLFDDVFAHESYIDEQNYVCFPKGKQLDITSNVCQNCYSAMCKGKILQKFIRSKEAKEKIKYYQRFYFGDGANDICGAMLLQNSDYLFPRMNFPLYKKLESIRLKTENVRPWRDGFDILSYIISLFS